MAEKLPARVGAAGPARRGDAALVPIVPIIVGHGYAFFRLRIMIWLINWMRVPAMYAFFRRRGSRVQGAIGTSGAPAAHGAIAR